MANLSSVIKIRNKLNTAWDNFFPVTLAGNVLFKSGKTVENLTSAKTGEGASLVGIHDAAGNFTSTTVEEALKEALTKTILIDDSTSTEFKVGIENGLIYIEEV